MSNTNTPAAPTWTNPEILTDARTWAAYNNATACLAEEGKPLTNETLAAFCRTAGAFCPDWQAPYDRVIQALGPKATAVAVVKGFELDAE